MKYLSNIALAAFAGCLSLALLPNVQADDWNKKTNLTVGETIQMPSCCTPDHTVTLQPGEYVMVLVDSLSDRHIVRVFDKDQKNVITTILAIPNYRLQPTGKTVLQYWEVPAGQPRALRAWFYPGDNFGQEFVYHKQKAVEIATFAKAPVPAVVVDLKAEDDLKTVPLVVVDETGKTSELALTAPEPAVTEPAQPQAPVETAAVVPTPTPVEPAQQTEPVEQTLPHTASAMPLLGLIGILSLAAFAVLSIRSKRIS
jgi:LPXTG-motif cell wall-anchored protein